MSKGRANKSVAKGGARWLPDHDDEILNLWLLEEPLKPLATKLGRTVKALERRVWALATNYHGVVYQPITRHDERLLLPFNERDQQLIAWMKRNKLSQDKKIVYAAQLLARPKSEIEKLMGLRREQKGFGL